MDTVYIGKNKIHIYSVTLRDLLEIINFSKKNRRIASIIKTRDRSGTVWTVTFTREL